MPLPGETGDFLFENLLGQQAGHLCVVLDQVELCVDRAVEGFAQCLSSWRLFGAGAMLSSHNGVLRR